MPPSEVHSRNAAISTWKTAPRCKSPTTQPRSVSSTFARTTTATDFGAFRSNAPWPTSTSRDPSSSTSSIPRSTSCSGAPLAAPEQLVLRGIDDVDDDGSLLVLVGHGALDRKAPKSVAVVVRANVELTLRGCVVGDLHRGAVFHVLIAAFLECTSDGGMKAPIGDRVHEHRIVRTEPLIPSRSWRGQQTKGAAPTEIRIWCDQRTNLHTAARAEHEHGAREQCDHQRLSTPMRPIEA